MFHRRARNWWSIPWCLFGLIDVLIKPFLSNDYLLAKVGWLNTSLLVKDGLLIKSEEPDTQHPETMLGVH